MDRGWTKHAACFVHCCTACCQCTPCRRREAVSTTVTPHIERQSHVTKLSTRTNDDSARPDMDTTMPLNMHRGQEPGHRRRQVLTLGASNGL